MDDVLSMWLTRLGLNHDNLSIPDVDMVWTILRSSGIKDLIKSWEQYILKDPRWMFRETRPE